MQANAGAAALPQRSRGSLARHRIGRRRLCYLFRRDTRRFWISFQFSTREGQGLAEGKFAALHVFGRQLPVAMFRKLRFESRLSHAENAGFQSAPNLFASVEAAGIVGTASMTPHPAFLFLSSKGYSCPLALSDRGKTSEKVILIAVASE